jgi:hypothetical protein
VKYDNQITEFMINLSSVQVFFIYFFYNVLERINILFELFIVSIQYFGWMYYTIQGEKTTTMRLLNNLEKVPNIFFTGKVYLRGKMYPSGIFYSKDCMGYIRPHHMYIEDFAIILITKANRFRVLIEEECADFIPIQNNDKSSDDGENTLEDDNINEINMSSTSMISVYNRCGNYLDFYYRKYKINVSNMHPKGDQEYAFREILAYYKKNKRGTFFIEGPPSTGKSSLGYLLAKELSAPFTHQLDPTLPGDTIYGWMHEMNNERATSNTPCILVIEEVDAMIQKIHEKKVQQHKNIPTSVYDKPTWSNFLDDMFFYNNVILILTSNTPKTEIDKLDVSYLRQGRISLALQMKKSVSQCEDNDSSPEEMDTHIQQQLRRRKNNTL